MTKRFGNYRKLPQIGGVNTKLSDGIPTTTIMIRMIFMVLTLIAMERIVMKRRCMTIIMTIIITITSTAE